MWLRCVTQCHWLQVRLTPPLPRPHLAPHPLVAALHIVGGQHAGLAGALHSAVHPALVNRLGVYDDIAIPEGDLVMVLGRIVVQCPVDSLRATQNTHNTHGWRQQVCKKLHEGLCVVTNHGFIMQLHLKQYFILYFFNLYFVSPVDKHKQ